MSAYDITVLEYAASPKHPVSGVIYGRHNAGTMNLPFAYVLLRNADTVVLVDCGYDAADVGGQIAGSIGVTNWHGPKDVLASVGLRPEDVQHLILTHAHFDHIGALAHFPNARVYIQKAELESWVWAMGKGRKFRHLMAGINPDDVLRLVKIGLENRLVPVDGRADNIIPGIDLVLAKDTHTAGSQYVVVHNGTRQQDTWVLAGDLVYTYENLHGGTPDDPQFVPPGLATGSQTNLVLAAEEMMAIAGGDLRRVVPVHEQKLENEFPSEISKLGLRIVRIVQHDAKVN